jgi:UDP-N-acetylglucosamine:LPS N-acetylglucosamine transferase
VTESDVSSPGRVAVVSASVGAGHDGAARELVRELRAAGYTVDCYDFLDLIAGGLGGRLRDAYEMELKVAPRTWGWLLRSFERHAWLTSTAGRLSARVAVHRLTAAIGSDAVAVVSTYPLASQALGWLRRTGRLAAPAATFLTDMSVHPLWVAGGIDLHLALHEVAAAQARRLGAGEISLCRPAVDPSFVPAGDTGAERAATRARHGVPPHAPVALVVAGSWGVGEVAEAATEIAATGLATPVTICGRNEELRERLTEARTGVALGWIDDMPALIRASDVVVQNAGGLTSLEAMACGVPVISYRCLPGHGTTNAAALDEAGLALWIQDQSELADGLKRAVTEPGLCAEVGELFAAQAPVDAIRALAGTLIGKRR